MPAFSYLIIFIFGLITGSFLNSIIYRLQTGESFLFKRSYCPNCKHQLSWQDLIPLFSFLALRGKCRYCQKSISLQYPLVELATGILFVLVLNYESGIMNYGLFNLENILASLFMILASCFLIIIFVYDLKHYIIPDKIIYPAIAIALLYNLLYSYFIINTIYAAFGAAAFFLVIVLISRGKWMGVGDIKLAFFMGLFLGWPNILAALFLAFFIGAIIGVGLIASRRKTLKSAVPFGPFLVVGTFIALFWGQSIINWYLNLFW
jgi:prepilin signal peptidase PulO-like enzyme (type II secretory pathway)